jgi:hypothetical protein
MGDLNGGKRMRETLATKAVTISHSSIVSAKEQDSAKWDVCSHHNTVFVHCSILEVKISALSSHTRSMLCNYDLYHIAFGERIN